MSGGLLSDVEDRIWMCCFEPADTEDAAGLRFDDVVLCGWPQEGLRMLGTDEGMWLGGPTRYEEP